MEGSTGVEQIVFPWWLIMLVGLWTAGLAGWLNERWSSTARWYALVCCLAYTALIGFVMAAGTVAAPVSVRVWLARCLTAASVVFALAAIGPPGRAPRWALLAAFGAAAAGLCACAGSLLAAIGVMTLTAVAGVGEWRSASHADDDGASASPPSSADVWRIGVGIGLVSLALLGAARSGMQAEPGSHGPSPSMAAPSEKDGSTTGDDFAWLCAGLAVVALAGWVGGESRSESRSPEP